MPFFIAWSVVKSLLKIVLCPFKLVFPKAGPKLHQTTMVVYTFIMPCILSGCIVIWSNGEGPLILLSAFVFVNALFFSLIVAHFDNSHVYNSPLTQACVHGQPDILRLLLQHGADPNRTADSLMTPMFAAYIHGNWECVNILESLHDQNLGHYEVPNHGNYIEWNNRDGLNWLTRFRLQGTQSFNLNGKRGREAYRCTPLMCSLCFCRVRPYPSNEIERQRRARPEHMHDRTMCDRGDTNTKNCCKFWLFLNAIILITVLIDWATKGYMWRYYITNFDWDTPGNYFCADSLPNNGTYWRPFQHTRVGAAGVFTTFSDIKLQEFNVDFDFRHVGREEGNAYTNPHPVIVEFDAAVRPHARYCPAAKEEEEGDGGVTCVSNCMPCDKVIGFGAESCKTKDVQDADCGNDCSGEWLVDSGGDYCSGEQLCDACEGDCDHDADCKESLYCFQRETSEVIVPGCRPGGDGDVETHDYCYDPSSSLEVHRQELPLNVEVNATRSDFNPEEYCNVAIKDKACDSPYFLRGVYPSASVITKRGTPEDDRCTSNGNDCCGTLLISSVLTFFVALFVILFYFFFESCPPNQASIGSSTFLHSLFLTIIFFFLIFFLHFSSLR